MQSATQYPLILKLLVGFGRVWLASLFFLILTPLIWAYGRAFGIPLVTYLTGALAMAAMSVLLVSMPLSWVLGCVGLILEWLSRHREKRKRKIKRTNGAGARSVRSIGKSEEAAMRLAEPKLSQLELTCADGRRRLESETEADRRDDLRGKR